MRYLAVLLILMAMISTWRVVNNAAPIESRIHGHLQRQLMNMIQSYVAEKRPAASPVVFNYLWTETLNSEEVKAYFSISYTDVIDDGGATDEKRAGTALLKRLKGEEEVEGEKTERWSLESVQVDQETLVFTDAIVITPGEGEPEGATSVPGEPTPSATTESE